MYIYYNANPVRKSHGDCVIRALSKVLDMTWEEVAIDLSMMQVTLYDMQNSDYVWGEYLRLNGFQKGFLPYPCPNCVTVREFCDRYPVGTFVVATGNHVVAVIDGNYYDTSDTRMIARLEPMYDEAKTEHERQMISNTINRIQSDK